LPEPLAFCLYLVGWLEQIGLTLKSLIYFHFPKIPDSCFEKESFSSKPVDYLLLLSSLTFLLVCELLLIFSQALDPCWLEQELVIWLLLLQQVTLCS
jgi:hypothetical protein